MQSGGVTDQQDQLTAGRVWIWTQLLPEFLDSPIWGSGVGSTAWSTMVKNGLYINHPHNLYLRILLDMGVLGMLLMFKFGNLILGELKRIASSTTTPAVFLCHVPNSSPAGTQSLSVVASTAKKMNHFGHMPPKFVSVFNSYEHEQGTHADQLKRRG